MFVQLSFTFIVPDLRVFSTEGIKELERFSTQKVADFRSILINYVQLQMHIHKKVTMYNTTLINTRIICGECAIKNMCRELIK